MASIDLILLIKILSVNILKSLQKKSKFLVLTTQSKFLVFNRDSPKNKLKEFPVFIKCGCRL